VDSAKTKGQKLSQADRKILDLLTTRDWAIRGTREYVGQPLTYDLIQFVSGEWWKNKDMEVSEIARLVSRGYLTQTALAPDGKSVTLGISERGRAILEAGWVEKPQEYGLLFPLPEKEKRHRMSRHG
jgi:hypothetical protein